MQKKLKEIIAIFFQKKIIPEEPLYM